MKQIIVILLLLLMCRNVEAGLYGKLELGIDTDSTTKEEVGYRMTRIDLGYRFDFFMFKSETYGSYLNWASEFNKPFMDIYVVGEKISYNKFFLRYEAYCCHPVVSNSQINTTTKEGAHIRYTVVPNQWIGKVRTVSIGYEFEIK